VAATTTAAGWTSSPTQTQPNEGPGGDTGVFACPRVAHTPTTTMDDVLDAASLLEDARRREDLGDDAGAIAGFGRAVELALAESDASTELAARSGLVRLHSVAGRLAEVDAQLESIQDGLTDAGVAPVARAEALSEWGLVLIERGEDSTRQLDEALRLVGDAAPDVEAARIQVRALMYRAHGERLGGEYGASRATLEHALEIAERTLRRDSPETAHVLNALGVLGKFSGEFDAAEEAYGRAARIIATRYGPDHPDMAAIHHNLAGLAHARGDFEAAEPLARRSVEIRERTSGPGHLAAILDRAGLAAILSDLHRDDEAAEILEAVLIDLEGTVGPEHREYAVTLNNLAAIDQRRGDLLAAEHRYRRALDIKQRTQGPDAPALATTWNNLGTVFRRQGRMDEAHAAYARAIGLLDGVVADDHPTLAIARRNIARIAQ
jgi:tetratricopeptide (TPR) repeat protein